MHEKPNSVDCKIPNYATKLHQKSRKQKFVSCVPTANLSKPKSRPLEKKESGERVSFPLSYLLACQASEEVSWPNSALARVGNSARAPPIVPYPEEVVARASRELYVCSVVVGEVEWVIRWRDFRVLMWFFLG